jgi:thiamine-phosphate pyrophosphorylase
VLLYYITGRSQFAGDEKTRRERLLVKIAEAARAGVDYIQLRERDLSTRELEVVAREAVKVVRAAQGRDDHAPAGLTTRSTRLLINSRIDVALAVGADGVHLRSDDIAASDARAIAEQANRAFVVAVSCHTVDEVHSAEAQGADFAVFAPVFEKVIALQRRESGVGALRQVCTGSMPVLALGGVTLENARACLQAGTAGIAAIRLFQEHDVAGTVLKLRNLSI